VIDGMSRETFDANEPVIRAAVKALMSNPQSRKRFRLLRLRETHTKELLAEVFRIPNYGPVIAHYSHGNPDSLTTVVVGAPRGRGYRPPGEPVIEPLTNDPDQRFPIMARSFQYRLPVRDLRQWIAEGDTEHFISYRV
jgi:hypothetical protein